MTKFTIDRDAPYKDPPPARECGDCSLCCKVMTIEALDKPQGKWCPQARPGKGGCAVYADRPTECQTFTCSWRSGKLPIEMKPNKIKAVIGSNLSGDAVVVHVDPSYPLATETGILADWIAAVVEQLKFPVIITCGSTRRLKCPPGKKVDVRDPATGQPWISDKDPERFNLPG
jgi:hypothetical protein